jgi:hypothetical protein
MDLHEKKLLNDRGIALVMVLILAAVSLAIMAALVYMLTASTQVSGIQKRYRTATAAGKGGANVLFQVIAAGTDPGYIAGTLSGSIPAQNINVVVNGANTDCLTAKLNNPTSSWQAVCDNSFTINTGDTKTYDMKFQLGTTIQYDVYAKIVDTVQGNSGRTVGAASQLLNSGVVNSNSGEVPVQSIPYLYTLEVQATNANNQNEKADYSILYEY